MKLEHNLNEEDCRIYEVLNFLSYKWNTFIILKFSESINEELNYATLKKEFPKITPRALSMRLKDLETNSVIIKKIKVENNKRTTGYKLTEKGKELLPLLLDLRDWGKSVSACKIEKECDKCSFIKNCKTKYLK